jgi:N-acetylglucosamine-6-phosphate deacetylase
MSKTIAIKAKRMVTPSAVVKDAVIVVKDGRIYDAGAQSSVSVPADAEVVDYGDKILAPGMMDIHCHGCFRNFAGEGVAQTLNMCKFILSGGTTSVTPTVGDARQTGYIVEALKIQRNEGHTGADIVGIHLEGPFVEPKHVEGIDTGDADAPKPDMNMLEDILKAGEGHVKLMGLGVLLPGAEDIVRRLREEGVVVAMAHSKANAAQFTRAIEAGYQHATHLFNVMTGLHHRRPGIVGGFLTHDGTTCELIGDGLHVHPWAMDVAIRCKGPDRIALITDLGLGGAPEGEHTLGVFGAEMTIVVKDGIARVKGSNETQDNTMAGSTQTQNVGIRNILKLGYGLPEAFRMGSLTPARIMGVDRQKGSIEITKDADIIVINDNADVLAAYVKGNLLYTA